jgi:S1-C subfamily serine protease
VPAVSGLEGALIVGVASGTPADAAGLVPGDTITAVGSRAIGSPAALTDMLGLIPPGRSITVRYLDVGGHRHAVAVRLGIGPPQ